MDSLLRNELAAFAVSPALPYMQEELPTYVALRMIECLVIVLAAGFFILCLISPPCSPCL